MSIKNALQCGPSINLSIESHRAHFQAVEYFGICGLFNDDLQRLLPDAGGAVTAPRLLTEVKPNYTSDALLHRIEGTIVLDVVVTRSGLPSDIRVVRSLDPGGLDEQAVAAVAQWRFQPGRLAGTPVDVLVTIMLDFFIR
jgi:TonB family protein